MRCTRRMQSVYAAKMVETEFDEPNLIVALSVNLG